MGKPDGTRLGSKRAFSRSGRLDALKNAKSWPELGGPNQGQGGPVIAQRSMTAEMSYRIQH